MRDQSTDVSCDSMKLSLQPLSIEFIPQVVELSDREFGKGYHTKDRLKKWIQSDGGEYSLVLMDEQKNLYGFRITFPAGSWLHLMKGKCETKLWNMTPESVAYFKSILISRQIRGQGWGSRLSEKTIKMLRDIKNTAIVCHSWKESPNNLSVRYLKKLGFKPIAEHKNFWSDMKLFVLSMPDSLLSMHGF